MNETQRVDGHIWWSNHLEVAVRDTKLGKTFRVQFTQAVDGVLRESGGGGCSHNEKSRFDSAIQTACEWVGEELGYEIVDKGTWTRTKSTRGMSYNDIKELRKLSEEQRRELAQMLRSGVVEVGDS